MVIARILSYLGSPALRTIAVVLVGFLLLARGHRREAVALAGTVGGVGLANTGVKKVVRRRRPFFSQAGGSSFPSGHASGIVALLGSGIWIGWRLSEKRGVLVLGVVAGLPLAGLVGWSRVKQDEHHVGDVLGGYLLGAIGLAAMIVASRRADDGPPSDR